MPSITTSINLLLVFLFGSFQTAPTSASMYLLFLPRLFLCHTSQLKPYFTHSNLLAHPLLPLSHTLLSLCTKGPPSSLSQLPVTSPIPLSPLLETQILCPIAADFHSSTFQSKHLQLKMFFHFLWLFQLSTKECQALASWAPLVCLWYLSSPSMKVIILIRVIK